MTDTPPQATSLTAAQIWLRLVAALAALAAGIVAAVVVIDQLRTTLGG